MSDKKKQGLQVGDFITCADADEMIQYMTELAEVGIDTDFNYDIPDTYRLEVLSVEEVEMEEKLDKFLAYLEENGVEISGETAFKCNDGVVLFSPNEEGGVDIAIIRNVIGLNYNLGITDADVKLFNTEIGIMQELGGEQ